MSAKRRKVEKTTELYKLLDLNPHNEEDKCKLDNDAIIRAAQQDPKSTDTKYLFQSRPWYGFPLQQAIVLGARADAIAALCSPAALEGKVSSGQLRRLTVLHLALMYGSSLSVVKVLIKKRKSLVMRKAMYGYTPLHGACQFRAPLEVVSWLINAWPEAPQQITNNGNTPLHNACHRIFPGSVPSGVIPLLLDQWPEATMQKNNKNKTPYDLVRGNKRASGNDKTLVSYVSAMFRNEPNHPDPSKMFSFFVKLSWWKGVMLVIDRYPLVIKSVDLPANTMANILSKVGHHCRLNTMWKIICNEQELLGGAYTT